MAMSKPEEGQSRTSALSVISGLSGLLVLLLLALTWGLPNSLYPFGPWILGYQPARPHALIVATAPGLFGILGALQVWCSRGRLKGLGLAAVGVGASVLAWVALFVAASL
jgi:hypothetical protein